MDTPRSDPSNTIIRLDRPAQGGAVGRAEDGCVTFVRHALPGELVRARTTEVTARFRRADAVEILEASAERVDPLCPYAHPGGCGGCDLHHASSLEQRRWKSAVVEEHLRRIAGVKLSVDTLSPTSSARGSRTRLRCAVDDEGRLGLFEARSRRTVALDACWVADGVFRTAFNRRWRGASEVELRAVGDGPAFAVVRTVGNGGDAYDVWSLDGVRLSPTTRSRVRVGENVFAVSPRSFWQPHRDAPSTLTDVVTRWLDPSPGDDVVDLFGGVGLFSLPLARLVGSRGRVTVVESSPFAVRDARDNLAGLAQATVRQWSVGARSINDAVREDSLVVLDPPRQGLARGTVASLVRRSPRRVVYVSCDAATFARDLKEFLNGGFVLNRLEVWDLFPMSEHVEVVALLDRGVGRVNSAGEAESFGLRPGG